MKKSIDYIVEEVSRFENSTAFLRLRPAIETHIDVIPGQFVNIEINHKDVFLRRPISICRYDCASGSLWLYVKNVGKGSSVICQSKPGDIFNIVLPLGKGFSMPERISDRILLVGGGVGVAPMLMLGETLAHNGFSPVFLLGGASASDIPLIQEFSRIGEVHITTVDGSLGTKGFVTDHKVLYSGFTKIYSCGPTPMMKAIAKYASDKNIECEVSLENRMACGLGACLCCVEDTVSGHQCVCTSGPVFNIKELKW